MNLDWTTVQSVFDGIGTFTLVGLALTAAGIYFGFLLRELRPEQKQSK